MSLITAFLVAAGHSVGLTIVVIYEMLRTVFESLLWTPELSLLPVLAGMLVPALMYARALIGPALLLLLLVAWYIGLTGLIAAFDGYGLDRDVFPVFIFSLVLVVVGASISAGAYITLPSWRSGTAA